MSSTSNNSSEETLLTSTELMERTGLSRATLNNYIALGILPKPVVKRPQAGRARTARMGHFPSSVLDTIDRVNSLKKQGHTMADIVTMLQESAPSAGGDTPEDRRTGQPVQGTTVSLTLDGLDVPAYLVNPRFELVWSNDQAQEQILETGEKIPSEISDRNLFALFEASQTVSKAEGRDDLLRLHLSLAKNRLTKSALMSLDPSIGDGEMEHLAAIYDSVDAAERGQILHSQANLARPGEPERWYTIYTTTFREGFFFAYVPTETGSGPLLDLLARRDIVIRDLLKKRRPYLTPLAVVVADIQDSVKICAELPPEEYFELINDIWGAMQSKLRRFYATHGKHAGDGVVYYFFPQPDCNYLLNAIRCAHEMKETMREISRTWQKRKNWMTEIELNIGIDEGQEWFGTYETPTHLEFTVLGDTINIGGRLSDFARAGSIWVTKNMLAKLTAQERSMVHYGIRRESLDGTENLIPSTYSRVSNLVDLENPKYEKFRDIAVLPVTEILDVEKVSAGGRRHDD